MYWYSPLDEKLFSHSLLFRQFVLCTYLRWVVKVSSGLPQDGFSGRLFAFPCETRLRVFLHVTCIFIEKWIIRCDHSENQNPFPPQDWGCYYCRLCRLMTFMNKFCKVCFLSRVGPLKSAWLAWRSASNWTGFLTCPETVSLLALEGGHSANSVLFCSSCSHPASRSASDDRPDTSWSFLSAHMALLPSCVVLWFPEAFPQPFKAPGRPLLPQFFSTPLLPLPFSLPRTAGRLNSCH